MGAVRRVGAMGAVVSHQLPLIPSLENEGEQIIAAANRKVLVLSFRLKCVLGFCGGLDDFMRS